MINSLWIIGILLLITTTLTNIQFCGAEKNVAGKSRDYLTNVITCGRRKNSWNEVKSWEINRRCEHQKSRVKKSRQRLHLLHIFYCFISRYIKFHPYKRISHQLLYPESLIITFIGVGGTWNSCLFILYFRQKSRILWRHGIFIAKYFKYVYANSSFVIVIFLRQYYFFLSVDGMPCLKVIVL